eukprot:gene30376-37580_t
MYATPREFVHEIDDQEPDDHFWTDHLNLYLFLLDATIYTLFHMWFFTRTYFHFQDVKRWENHIIEEAEKSMEGSVSSKAMSMKGASLKKIDGSTTSPKKRRDSDANLASRRYLHFAVNGHFP